MASPDVVGVTGFRGPSVFWSVSRNGGRFTVVDLAVWTRLPSSENSTESSRVRTLRSRLSQWFSIRVRVPARRVCMLSKCSDLLSDRFLELSARFAIYDDRSKQVIKESWNMLSTSLTLLRYSRDMESASSTELPVVRVREISSV